MTTTKRGFTRKATHTTALIAGIVAFVAPLLVTRDASAQEFLKDRRYQEGIGYRTGDFELHPGIAGEVGYDSNWFARSNKVGPNIANGAPQNPPLEAGLLRITPSFTISTLRAQRKEGDSAAAAPPTLGFRAGVAGTYREFIGKQEIRDQRNMSVTADARLDILPQQPWGAAIFANFARTIQPNTVNADPNNSFNRDDVGVGAEVIAIPGGGTLDWRLGYQLHATLFEDTQGVGFNNLTHEIFTKGRWKFRPRTAMLYDATLRFRNYTQADRTTQLLHSSDPLRARLGLEGLITPRFSLLGIAGYGTTFTRPGADATVKQYNSVIGQLEAKFFLTANPAAEQGSAVSLSISTLTLGYTRDFSPSYLGDFYGLDRGYAKVSYFFAGRAIIALEGGAGAIQYPDIFFAQAAGLPGGLAQKSFTDARVDATLFGEYRFTNTFGLNTTLRYTANFSGTQLPLPTAAGMPAQVYDMNWRRFEAFIGARWFL